MAAEASPPVTLHAEVACPTCGCSSAWRSRRRLLDRVVSVVGLYPYRCAACYKRYYAPGRVTKGTQNP